MANETIENEETLEDKVDETTAAQKLEEKAKKEKKKKTRKTVFKILLVIIILFLINVYIILSIFYKGENFTVTLDSEYGRESGLVIYEDQNKYTRTFLRSKDIDFFTDISVNWLPEDIDNEGDGSHNGKNYIAYTFYAENMGQDTINYWTTIKIDDVIKDVDEAIRVMVIKNGNKVIYAKNNRSTEQPEPNTIPFKDKETVMLEKTENFKVGDIDKYTVVIWVEGDDPECTDDLIGGEIKMHMTLTEEHILQQDFERKGRKKENGRKQTKEFKKKIKFFNIASSIYSNNVASINLRMVLYTKKRIN